MHADRSFPSLRSSACLVVSSVAAIVLLSVLPGCALDDIRADFAFLNLEPETIDPGRVGDQAGGRIVANLFEGLTVRERPSLVPGPGIATHWHVSSDGLTWTFHLRESMWSDGTALTSEDFRWSWERVLTPATASRSAPLLFAVRGARAFHAGELRDAAGLGLRTPDAATFVVELERPLPYLADLAATPPLCPAPRQVVEAHGDRWTRPEHFVGNGPFVLVEHRLHQRMRLQRNERSWRAARVALRVVDAVPGDFANANFNLYTSGVLDWVDSGGIPPALVDAVRGRSDWHASPFLATYFLRCNVARPPLDDARVRRALSLALDAQAITTHVTRAGQQPAHSLVPPGLPGYEEVRAKLYDPVRARSLLAEAGYPGGEGFPAITLLFNTSEWHRQIAEVLQQQWREALGIELRLQNQEWKVFTVTERAGDFDLARGSWIGDVLDASNFLDIFTTGNPNNRTGFASARYDSLIRAAAYTLDPVARAALLRECESIVVEQEAIVLPVYTYAVTNLYDGSRWEGLEPDLLNTLDLRTVRPRDASLRGSRAR